MKKMLTLLILSFFTMHLFSQDKIYKIKGPVINAKVIEIATDKIKYRLTDNPDGPIYVVDKSFLNRIEFANGKVENYKETFKDPETYSGQSSKAIKVNFLSPFFGYTQVTFEKIISPLKSYEVSMGIIGIGRDKTDYYYNYGESKTYKRSAFGLFTEAGYKFNKLPNLFTKGNRLAHIMQGTYVKPSVTFGFYNDVVVHNKMGNLELDHRNNIFGAIILNLGHQWVIGDKFLVDLYYGLGFAFDNMKSDISGYNTNIIYNHFVVQKGGQGANFGVNGGLKIGLLF